MYSFHLFPKLIKTHRGRVTHICVSELNISGSDNGLSPGRHQAIIWTNAGILLIGHLGINFNGILIAIYTFSFERMHLKMSFGKWLPFCLSLNVLKKTPIAVRSWYGVKSAICSVFVMIYAIMYHAVCIHHFNIIQVYPHNSYQIALVVFDPTFLWSCVRLR